MKKHECTLIRLNLTNEEAERLARLAGACPACHPEVWVIDDSDLQAAWEAAC